MIGKWKFLIKENDELVYWLYAIVHLGKWWIG